MDEKTLKHPKEDRFEILTTICVDLNMESGDLGKCYYTENIYIAAFLKAMDLRLVAIHRCREKQDNRTFTHFWFENADEVKPYIMSYHNDTKNNNVNASGMVTALQAIKKILNVGR